MGNVCDKYDMVKTLDVIYIRFIFEQNLLLYHLLHSTMMFRHPKMPRAHPDLTWDRTAPLPWQWLRRDTYLGVSKMSVISRLPTASCHANLDSFQATKGKKGRKERKLVLKLALLHWPVAGLHTRWSIVFKAENNGVSCPPAWSAFSLPQWEWEWLGNLTLVSLFWGKN